MPGFNTPPVSFTEDPLADDIFVAIQKTVDGLESEVGHAYVVCIGIDQGDGDSSAPILDDRAFLLREPLLRFLFPPHFTRLRCLHQARLLLYHHIIGFSLPTMPTSMI